MSELLNVTQLMALGNLNLASKITVEGLRSGLNNSLLKGKGIEFSQYRSYQPGDDLRALDWKMFARSDRYYIRDAEIETNLKIRILIDTSASMNHQDGNHTKLDYARYFAACIAYLAYQQGDEIGLASLSTKGMEILSPHYGSQHLARVFNSLEKLKGEGSFEASQKLNSLLSSSSKPELWVFISDFYQQNDEIFEVFNRVSPKKQELIAFHLISPNELNLTYQGYSSFEDLETGKILQFDPELIKKEYQLALNEYINKVKIKAQEKNIHYSVQETLVSPQNALRNFLIARNKMVS